MGATNNAPTVVGVGAAVVDYIGVVEKFPHADTQVEMQTFSKQVGGNVATALATLSRLDIPTAYLGKFGDDELAQLVRYEMQRHGVNLDSCLVEPGGSIGFAFIIVEAGTGRRTILWTNEGKSHLKGAELDNHAITSARFLHLDQYAEEYTQLNCCADALQALRSMTRAHTIVITEGRQGSYCLSHGDLHRQAAFEIDPVDTTGCGDVYHGAFIYALLQNWTLAEAARFSSAAAALNCRALGGQAGIPNLDEIFHFQSSAKEYRL